MTIARTGKMNPAKKARANQGNCKVCHLPIVPGQRYFAHVLGTNSSPSGSAHEECYMHPQSQVNHICVKGVLNMPGMVVTHNPSGIYRQNIKLQDAPVPELASNVKVYRVLKNGQPGKRLIRIEPPTFYRP